ncbi:MAG: hypothetical protein Q4F03_09480 [Eubacteriales bacterium]|nr:hypothetical protein [Eubacteriales bacterium]
MVLKQFSGYCPYKCATQKIIVEYKPVPMAGHSKPGYKKTGVNCENYHECQNLDSYGRCPLMIDAPSEP